MSWYLISPFHWRRLSDRYLAKLPFRGMAQIVVESDTRLVTSSREANQ